MRFDPRRRLQRRMPGEDIQPGSALRLHLDEDRPTQQDPIPARDQKELISITQRPSRRLAEAGPNAPQLIRLIRTPYGMTCSRPGRITIVEPRAAAEARPPFGAALESALAEWPEVRSTPAAPERPRPFAPRPSAIHPIPPLPKDPA